MIQVYYIAELKVLVKEKCLKKAVTPVAKINRPTVSSSKKPAKKPKTSTAKSNVSVWNSNRVFDIENLVKMRKGQMKNMRNNTLHLYCAALCNITDLSDDKNKKKVEDAVQSLNASFTSPGPLPLSDVKAICRHNFRTKNRKKFCESKGDERMLSELQISDNELKKLRNCYTKEQKCQRNALTKRIYRKSKGKHKGPHKVLCENIVLVCRLLIEKDLSAKKLIREGLSKTTSYRIAKLINDFSKEAAGMSESGYHELFTGKMLPELKDIDKNQKSSFSILLYHYAVTGDIAEWISTDDGKCAYDILQGIRHGDMETGEEVGSASSDDPFVDLLRSFDISDDIIDTFKQKHKKGSYKYISEHPFE